MLFFISVSKWQHKFLSSFKKCQDKESNLLKIQKNYKQDSQTEFTVFRYQEKKIQSIKYKEVVNWINVKIFGYS